MLENYDNTWHDIGSEHRASFFNIPPGSYIFKVKAISGRSVALSQNQFALLSVHPGGKPGGSAFCR